MLINLDSCIYGVNSFSRFCKMSNIAEDFQKELNSILDAKPPISKAKMNSIVKAAIKSVKYYKHVVYYVENFIKNVCILK